LKKCLIVCSALLASCTVAQAQQAHDDIHINALGPSAMCGLRGVDAADLIQQVKKSADFRRQSVSTRFELFVSNDRLTQWVFTQPPEEAYPTVTCRYVYRDGEGNWQHKRVMRCEANREACDRLFGEFEELDEQFRQTLQKSDGGG
jgi:hypothetical protein